MDFRLIWLIWWVGDNDDGRICRDSGSEDCGINAQQNFLPVFVFVLYVSLYVLLYVLCRDTGSDDCGTTLFAYKLHKCHTPTVENCINAQQNGNSRLKMPQIWGNRYRHNLHPFQKCSNGAIPFWINWTKNSEKKLQDISGKPIFGRVPQYEVIRS